MRKFKEGDRVVIQNTSSNYWRGRTATFVRYLAPVGNNNLCEIMMDIGGNLEGFYEYRLEHFNDNLIAESDLMEVLFYG